jgi:nitrite reductase/ring-hydroxylating ferredoxin subunit
MVERLPRKLAAILYADVAGYSRLTGDDEDATHRKLSEYLDLISESVEQHRGHVMHYAGDAVLAMFDAVVDSLVCATHVQRDLQSPINSTITDDRGVVCRWHCSCFDLQTGEVREWATRLQEDGTSPGWEFLGDISKNQMKLTVYPCRIHDGYLWIAPE